VIDLLNIEPSFIHHWRAYGFWAPAIQDYLDKDIMDWGGTKEYKALMKN
jgi:PhoPQ-activated pathogenicity-related protein